MNSKLYDKTQGEVVIPNNIKNHLINSFAQAKGANENVVGFNRNKELQSQEKISYGQLKRIKNFFDTFGGKENELPFILNGGNVMKTWINGELNKMRNKVKGQQHVTQPDDSRVKAQDYKNNVQDLSRPSQSHKTSVNRHATAIADAAVTESLRRIKDLISKI
jgi:hypothetical protein